MRCLPACGGGIAIDAACAAVVVVLRRQLHGPRGAEFGWHPG
ncbi:hypothetical protein ACFU8W_33990 [Streptomyces sp. NPDC057565]